MQQISFPDYSRFKLEVTLDKEVFVLEYHWNTRGKYWSLTVTDREGNIAVAGMKMTLNYDMLEQHRARRIPNGVLMAIDTASETLNSRIGRRDMYEDRDIGLIFAGDYELNA